LQGTLRCGDTVLQFGIFENDAVIEIDGRRIVLPRVANSPDSRFAVADSPATVLSENGDTITITLEGTALGACSPIPPPVPQPIRARGNEPGWTLEISDGNLRLTTDYGAATLEASVGEPRFEGGAFLYETAEATIRLAPGLCRDDMTGMPYPETAEVRLGSRRLTGCGGEPSALLQGEWIVEDIGGAGIVESSRITLAFDGSALGGEASCNRYATSFVIGGEGVSVGQIAATKRMCPEVLMEQELRFFRALDKVGRFDIDQTGALLLFDPASPEPIITARR
jgi:heat shock protein HslJ